MAVAAFSANDRSAALADWEKEGAVSRTRIWTLVASPLATACVPRLSLASAASSTARMVPPFRLSASAGTAMPSPSKSSDRTV